MKPFLFSLAVSAIKVENRAPDQSAEVKALKEKVEQLEAIANLQPNDWQTEALDIITKL